MWYGTKYQISYNIPKNDVIMQSYSVSVTFINILFRGNPCTEVIKPPTYSNFPEIDKYDLLQFCADQQSNYS